MSKTIKETAPMQDSLRRDDMRVEVKKTVARKPTKRWVILAGGSARHTSKMSRRAYSKRVAQRAVRLLGRMGVDAYLSPVTR